MSSKFASLTVAVLRDLLKKQGLPFNGLKAELVERLEAAEGGAAANPSEPKEKRKRSDSEAGSEDDAPPTKQAAKPKPKPKAGKAKAAADEAEDAEEAKPSGDSVPLVSVRALKPEDFDGKRMLRLASWNAAGLNGIIKGDLHSYLEREKPDLLCIQETKLRASAAADAGQVEGYKAYDSCSEKPGYAGTRTYVREGLAVKGVTYGLLGGKHNDEGRTVTVELEDFYVVNTYVPNSGMKLERLDYRVKTWDKALREYLRELQRSKPIIWTGDLNVAERDYDRFMGANLKAMEKCPGYTPQERHSFREILKDLKLVDSFRHLFPEQRDVYSFWSRKYGLKNQNKGWRLDYFVVSEQLVPRVADSFMQVHVAGSDHCPIELWLQK
eukprot:TRINITY_DN23911_c0_g1_i1.p1 TRINITY_DN23911_c0_g1~~TRINITY_DN23911_c0_g1_i1.p1  ORF type:complete len:397 (-),score=95.32 TRINITY_DN23911_c0_g1_i1:434-1582(-)